MNEGARRSNNRDRVLQYLQAHGSATNAELIEIGGFRAMARVWEIGKDYQVDVVKVKGGLWRVDFHGPKPQPSLLSLMEGGA